jgi:HSP20 family protein
MAVVRWDPFRELTQMQGQLNRLVDSMWGGREQSWLPAVDVFDRQDAVVLKAELPGIELDDVHIEVDDNVLTLKGERRFEERVDDERYHRVERRFGSFQRSLALPQGVKTDEIEASYEDGVLTVNVPKSEQAQPKQIPISRQGKEREQKTIQAKAA